MTTVHHGAARRSAGAITLICLLSIGACSDSVDPGPVPTPPTAPTASDDGYETDVDVPLTEDAGSGLLANDDLGSPAARIESFGAGTLTGEVTDHPAGSTVSPIPTRADGSITVSADGSIDFTPPTGVLGPFDLYYRLANEAGSVDAQVTVTVTDAPAATVDSYQTMAGAALDVAAGPDDLLANDALGYPEAAVTTFGGGDLGGDVSDHTAGNTVSPLPSFADGSLTVSGDGTLSLVPPSGFEGDFSFEYEIGSASGTSTAAVEILVTNAPTTQPDVFATPFETTLSVADGPGDLLANDALGTPAGTLVSFGGGSLGGAVTDQAAGATISPLPGEADGLLTVAADGAFVFTPATGYDGTFTFHYRAESASGASDALVAVTVDAPPLTVDDPYPQTVIGNVGILSANVPFSVTDNDSFGDDVTITAFDATSAEGGQVGMTTSGSGVGEFTYDPPAGFEGEDTFTYTITNASGSDTGTVTLTVSGVIWFVDNGAPAGGDGRLSAPFDALADFDAINDGLDENGHAQPGDAVFIHESSTPYVGPVDLLGDQKLIGQDATTDLAALVGVTLPSGSVPLPAMDPGNAIRTVIESAGDAVRLTPLGPSSADELHGLTIGDTGPGSGISAPFFGSLTVRDVDITGTGQTLSLSNGTVDAVFGELSSSSSAGHGLELSVVDGALSNTNATSAIAGWSADGIQIGSGTIDFTYQGAVTGTSHPPVSSFALGGTQRFEGAITSEGAGIVVAGTGNVIFTGPLTIDAGGSTGFQATGGTVEVAPGANTITTTTGRAVDITTTIGSNGVTFRSVSSDGAVHGIRLRNTGTSGFFTVSGDGPTLPSDATRGRTASAGDPDSGGLITNATEDGVYLENAHNVTLRNMVIGDPGASRSQPADAVNAIAGAGIEIRDVSNLVLDNVLISRTGGHGIDATQSTTPADGVTLRHSEVLNAGDGPGERAISIGRITGAILIEKSVIDGMSGDGVRLGVLDGVAEVTLRSSLISDNDEALLCGGGTSTCEGNGLIVFRDDFLDGTPHYVLVVEDSELTGIDGTAIDAAAQIGSPTASTAQVTVSNSHIHSNPQGETAFAFQARGPANELLIDDLDITDHAGDMVSLAVIGNLNARITASGAGSNAWTGASTGPATGGLGLAFGVNGNGTQDPDVVLLVENTEVTRVARGLSVSCAGNMSASARCEVTVRNSTFGRSGSLVESDPVTLFGSSTYPVNFSLEGVTMASSTAAFAFSAFAFSEARVHATLTDNSTTGGDLRLVSSGTAPTLCSNATGNDPGGGQITLEVGSTATHEVVQVDAAAVSTANSGATVIESGSGTLTYGAPTCTLPAPPN